MVKDLITDLKLSAMDMKIKAKDTIHSMTTKMPEPVQYDFSIIDSQSIKNSEMEYMSSMNTGWTNTSQMTAFRIDMIAEKINFVSEMIQQGILAFDDIEEELKNCVRSGTPPQPQQLLSLAGRIDTNQKQIFMGLQKLRELSTDIDKATDKLQNSVTTSWRNF